MATVTFDNVSRIYSKDARPAVDSLNLDIADGEFVCLVGPSGCGKSTSLRMLAGLEPTDRGSILIGGRDATGVAPRDRDVAMVFQNYALYPNMTVAQNIGFALRNRGVSKTETAEKVAEAARILQLTEFLDRKPANLSGGQRQRVAMGRAIVRNPAVFCMDEPLSNLDAKLRVSTRSQISSLQRRLGTTTVYVTHDQVEAMTMGDRVAVLNDGLLQQVAAPREIYDTPANTFVAGFIGSPAMNLMVLPLAEAGAKFGSIHLPLTVAQKTRSDKEIVVGVRPEGWEISPSGEGVQLRVDHIEELGHEAYGFCSPVSTPVKLLNDTMDRIAVHSADSRHFNIGDEFWVRPRPEAMHVFSFATGARI